MKKQIKYFKNVLGASLMEVIFVLGIMAVLSPVVIKFAFKDLADVRYLNLAKQLKELIKSLTGYASSERDSWNKESESIGLDSLQKYGLENTISEDILKNLSLKYVKGEDDSFALYGVVDMTSFGLDAISFNKTLLYVENNVGYVVSGEKCGDCTSVYCACATNGNWGVDYSKISSNGESTPASGKRLAVVRIDDSLIEKEYESTVYLYRNKSGAGLNEMGRDLFLGEDDGAGSTNKMYDVKNVKEVNAVTVTGLSGGTEESPSVQNLPLLKAKKGTISSGVTVNGSIFFKETATHSLTLNGAKIFVPKIIFEKATVLSDFIATNASLLIGDLGNYKPKITVAALTALEYIDLQNLVFTHLVKGSGTLNIYGLEEIDGNLGVEREAKSRLRVEVPNVKVANLKTKVLSVNNNAVQTDNGNIRFQEGVIYFKSDMKLHLYDIKGATNGRDVRDLINEFNKGTTGSGNSIRCKLLRYTTPGSSC